MRPRQNPNVQELASKRGTWKGSVAQEGHAQPSKYVGHIVTEIIQEMCCEHGCVDASLQGETTSRAALAFRLRITYTSVNSNWRTRT